MIRTSRWASVLLLAGLLPLAATRAEAAPPAVTTADLAWMTGYWAGPVGDQIMEENWNAPRGGTLASTVRMIGPDGTHLVELVIIREHEGSLVLVLQQFRPDFSPLTPAPQRMRLAGSGEQSVTFEDAEGSPGLQRLTYARRGDTFTVEALLPDGNTFKAALGAH